MASKKMVFGVIASLAAVGLIGGCNKGSDSANPGLQPHKVQSSVAAPAAVTVTQSGAVAFEGYTHEDGTAIGADEVATDVAAYPTLGTDVGMLQSAASAAINSDGSVTLYDANGNTLETVGGSTTMPDGTIQSVAVSTENANASASADQAQSQAQSQTQCAPTNIVFDLEASSQPQASSSQQQDQQQQQEPAKQVVTVGFDVILTMPCEQPKQQPAEQPKEQPKQEPAVQHKQQPAEQPKQQPAVQPKVVPTATPCPSPTPVPQGK